MTKPPSPTPDIAIPSAKPRRRSNHAAIAFAYPSGVWIALVISATANISVKIQKTDGLSPSRLVHIAYTTRPGSATRRILQRSIIRPRTGTARAEKTPPTDKAKDTLLRCQPVSAMIGLRNTPKVNPRTGPLQTNSPQTAPTTTHQGLVNFAPIQSSSRAQHLRWS